MTKSMERLIEKVVNTSGNNAKELERVEFVNGLIISDCIQCNSPFKGDKLYINVDENTNIIVLMMKVDASVSCGMKNTKHTLRKQ